MTARKGCPPYNLPGASAGGYGSDMNIRPDNIEFDGATGTRLAPEYRPLLLKIWFAGALITFAALEFCIYHRGSALRAEGYSYWSAANFYIRYVPGHLLSLTQAQSHIWIAISAAFAGVLTSTLASCVLTPDPVFADLNRASGRFGGQPLLRGRAVKLALAFLTLIFAGVPGLIGLDIINTITVDLDQKVITGPPGVDNYYLALNSTLGFVAVLASSPSGKSRHWEVLAQRPLGHHFRLLDIELDFSNDQKIAFLITEALNDFVTSRGQNLPTH
jgi:hypothetical protein